MRRLTLKQLQALSVIARRGTITAAAGELYVTPAALTSRLKQLEEEAGLRLFDRTSEGLRPTDAGREMLRTVDSINLTIGECTARLQALKGLAEGRVSIGVVSTAKYFAPRAIATFLRAHPGIEINFAVGIRSSIVAFLRGFDVDLAILSRPPAEFAVETGVLGENAFVVIAPPDHPLAHEERLTKADLASEPFLVREEGSGTRIVFEEFMSGVVVKRPRLGEIASNETIKQLVTAGLGIALISAHTVSAEVQSGRLAILQVEGLPIRRQWLVVRRSDRALGPAALACWNFLVEKAAECLPSIAFAAPHSPRAAAPDEHAEADSRGCGHHHSAEEIHS
jgi:DNA-binding transcriptional LysR family regulator